MLRIKMNRPRLKYFLVFVSFMFSQCSAFYIPGVAPNEYHQDEEVKIKVRRLAISW